MEYKPEDQEEQFPKDQVEEDQSKYQGELMTSLGKDIVIGRYCLKADTLRYSWRMLFLDTYVYLFIGIKLHNPCLCLS